MYIPVNAGQITWPKKALRGCCIFVCLCLTSACGLAQQLGHNDVGERLGYPRDARLLLIQAEDLGMAHSIDRASFYALEKGWVTTAGVIVPGPWFPEVARWSRNHPQIDLGIRLDLNSEWSSYRWRPISRTREGDGLTDQGGYLSSSQIYVAQHSTSLEVEGEAAAQISLAQKAGLPISHLDNHMRALVVTPAMFESYYKMGQEYGLPIVIPREWITSHGTPTQKADICRIGRVDVDIRNIPIDRELEIMPGLAQKEWLSAYEMTLDALPPGVYLLSVHLGFNDDELQAMTWDHPDWGAQWRQNDYDVISSPQFQKFLKDKGFILMSWKDLSQRMPKQN